MGPGWGHASCGAVWGATGYRTIRQDEDRLGVLVMRLPISDKGAFVLQSAGALCIHRIWHSQADKQQRQQMFVR